MPPLQFFATAMLLALPLLAPVPLQASLQTEHTRVSTSSSSGTQRQRAGEETRESHMWVAFSSRDFQKILAIREVYREQGYAVDILSTPVDSGVTYRLAYGHFATREEAYAGGKPAHFPSDSRVLALDSSMSLVPDEAGLTQEPSTVEDPISPPPSGLEASFYSRHLDLELQFSNVYESNIDHDLEPSPSYGMVPALHARFRNRPESPSFVLDYVVARHTYTNTDRWDRMSNLFRAAFEPEMSDRFHTTTSGEISLKGSSEDRDVSNQFQILQEFEFRLTRRHRLQLYGTYRIKRFPDDPRLNALKPNIGLNFRRTNSDGERFETGARFEMNQGREARRNYRRWTFSVEYRTPEFSNRSQFKFEIKNRRKFYQDRSVEIDDEDHLRHDNRLSINAEWFYEVWQNTTVQLSYEYETRGSNDPEKFYEANSFDLQFIFSL